MNSSSDTPMYNLKAVVQETGLKPDTLHAWERRYGLPDPQRTDSGHRLYSQNDINMLKWLSTRQDEGMSISRAVELWRSLQAAQANRSQLQSTDALDQLSTTAMALPTTMPQGAILVEVRDAWVASCTAFDEQRAEQIISQACAMLPIETVCLEIIQQGLAKIGENWYKGKITVQQEHFASALAIRRLEALLAATPAPTRPGRCILVGCPAEEVHTFAPLLLTLLLRRRGWDILFLGANVPLQNMLLTIQTAKPVLIVLTAQQLYTAANLYEVAQMLARERIPLAFGGKIFSEIPDLPQRIAGYYLGDRLDAATQAVEQVMTLPRPQLIAKPVTLEYQAALAQFRVRQPRIEAEVWRSMGKAEIPYEDLGKANLNFSRNIMAALTLGDIDYVGVDLVWINGLLSNHYQLPTHLIDDYLRAYLDAIEIHTEQQEDAVITHWLRGILTKGIPDVEETTGIDYKRPRRNWS